MSGQHDDNWDGATLDFQCAKGEAIFNVALGLVLQRRPTETGKDVGHSFAEAIRHLDDVDEDRAIILVCALILENSVDACLNAIAPKFSKIADNRDVTFSLKTNLLEALRLFPAQIIAAIEPIRKIRNEFAHQLEIKHFDAVEQKFFDSLKAHAIRLLPNYQIPSKRRDLVTETTRHILIGLRIFRLHLSVLREYLDTDLFRHTFEQYCISTSADESAQ